MDSYMAISNGSFEGNLMSCENIQYNIEWNKIRVPNYMHGMIISFV